MTQIYLGNLSIEQLGSFLATEEELYSNFPFMMLVNKISQETE